MTYDIPQRFGFVAALTALYLLLSATPAAALTQHDWMVALVDSLGR